MISIIDKHFLALPRKKKIFLGIIGTGYLLIALIGYFTGLMNLVEAFLILVIGIIYSELLKLQYRIQDLEIKPANVKSFKKSKK